MKKKFMILIVVILTLSIAFAVSAAECGCNDPQEIEAYYYHEHLEYCPTPGCDISIWCRYEYSYCGNCSYVYGGTHNPVSSAHTYGPCPYAD